MAPPAAGIKVNADGIPPFDDLPLRAGDPRRSAWGLYGEADELGTLNRLTGERVAAAARSEIRTGERISLNWPMDAQGESSFFERGRFRHEIAPHRSGYAINDDTWTFNSQVSTQWDGLRHFGYAREGLFYNGVTMERLHARDPVTGRYESTVNGIQAWAEQGIIGRGVLADFDAWRATLDDPKPFDPFDTTSISAEDIKACLAAQGTEMRCGDILFIRSGFRAAHAAKPEAELRAHQAEHPHRFGGLEQSEAVLRLLWEEPGASAVAGDHPTLERWPHDPAAGGWLLHEVLLGGRGMPIGELFDLECLAAACARLGRWSFFLTSEVCNVPGAVASPPNAVAIF